MRPIRLEMNGFASFRAETVVDFEGADYFALVGPTGAGKSTVIDAMVFALFGSAPRWAGPTRCSGRSRPPPPARRCDCCSTSARRATAWHGRCVASGSRSSRRRPRSSGSTTVAPRRPPPTRSRCLLPRYAT
ncbi:AAA family ATPase [Tessaracoccus sp. HDW20]|nr:AAA family ATPase [Tessaracoccus coleopterorum]